MSICPRKVVTVLSVAAILAAGASPRLRGQQRAVATERAAGPTVDFVAVEADGTPVAELQPTEVEIRIGDRARAVRSLRRVTTAPLQASANAPARVPPPYGTNAGVNAGRRFVFVVDQESFDAGRSPLFRNAVEGLLAEFAPADQAMVAALPFGGVPLSFTSDKARVRLAIERLTGQGSRTETGSDLACRTRRFLESLEGFLQNQAARPGPVTLVLFTAGLAAPRRDAPMGLQPGMCELPVEQFRKVATAAGAARANVYVLQPADVGFGASPSRQTFAGAGERGSDNPLEGIEHLVGVTGATRFPLDAAGTASLHRVARESSAYFAAELEPISGEVFGRTRPLSVRVSRRGVTVRARPEVTLTEQPRAGTLPLTAKDLLTSTDAFTDLQLRTGAFTVRDADGRLRLGVVVEPAERGIALTSAGAIVVAEDGQVVSHWFAKDASERPLLGAMAVAPGTYRLRVAAIDGAGRAGVTEDTIDAELATVGPLSLGSLTLGVSRDGTRNPLLEFGAEPTAVAYFDIYGGDAGLPLAARLEIARDLDGPAFVTLPVALTRADPTRVVASGTVPLGALPAGDYVVRGVVRLEGGETGRVVRTLRKVAR